MALNFLLKRSGTADKRPDPASMALGELDLNYDDVTGGVFYKDASGNAVKVGPAQVSADAPNATPAGSSGNSAGEFWYDTANSALKIWDGSTWQETGGGGGIDPSIFTAKGQILTASAASTPTALPVGTNGQVLYANSACTTGLCWGAVPQATRTTFGTVLGCTSTTSFNVSLDPSCSAFTSITSGTCNVAIGRLALACVTSGSRNEAMGNAALVCLTTGCGNVGIGAAAGFFITAGQNNTALGTSAGRTISTGSQNVAIGYCTDVASATGSCQLAIGFDLGQFWLTGDSTKAIKPGAGIIDCAGSCGTAGQVLSSNGSNAIEWIAAGGGGGGVAGVTGTSPITVDNTDPANPIVGIDTSVVALPVISEANKALTSATPVDLLEWSSGVRMGTLVVMGTDGSTNHVWANITIGADTGVGTSAVVTSSATGFGTFAITAGGSGETVVTFTPNATLASVDFVYQYTAAFGGQPTVL